MSFPIKGRVKGQHFGRYTGHYSPKCTNIAFRSFCLQFLLIYSKDTTFTKVLAGP